MADCLKVFSSTVCTLQQPGDKLGKALGWASLLPFLSAFYQLVHVYLRRELRSAMALLGVLVNQMISMGLKDVVRQARPPTCQAMNVCSSYGMPSSHSQCISFAATMYVAIVLHRPAAARIGKLVQGLQGAALIAACGMVGWSRVYLGYHTPAQVAAGLALGTALGLLWHGAVCRLSPHLPALEATWACRVLGMKDSAHLPDVVAFEYENARRSRASGRPKEV